MKFPFGGIALATVFKTVNLLILTKARQLWCYTREGFEGRYDAFGMQFAFRSRIWWDVGPMANIGSKWLRYCGVESGDASQHN